MAFDFLAILPKIVSIESLNDKPTKNIYSPASLEETCYLDFTLSPAGEMAGLKVTYAQVTALCQTIVVSDHAIPCPLPFHICPEVCEEYQRCARLRATD